MRICYAIRILFMVIVFCFMQGCILWQRPFIRPIPVFIEDRHIEVEVIEDKIVIRILVTIQKVTGALMKLIFGMGYTQQV